jgi:Kef-type K+ transport system membrane component KefB
MPISLSILLFKFSIPFKDPVLVFSLVLLIILFAPLIFKRLRMPGIIGLILAGVIVGPNGLNLLLRDVSIQLFGTVGLLYIMFVAGLEIDLNEFRKNRFKSLVLGAFSFAIPQLLGILAAHYLLGFSVISAILLGGVLASHTLLAYPIVSKLGLSKSEVVTITVGSTLIADTCSLLVLAVIAESSRGEVNILFWTRLLVSTSIFLFILFWVYPRVGQWFFRNIESEGVSQYTFVLAMVFLSGFLSELAGLEPIIGAFLAGLSLNRLIPHTSPLMNRIEFVGNALFIPFFLISVGMLVDLRMLLQGPAVWVIAGTMIFVATAGKWVAAYFTQKIFRYSLLERNLIFGLSEARAAASLAAVLVGFELEIFDENVLNGTVIMILATCVVSSLMVENTGRKLAIEESNKVPDLSEIPSRILVPISNPATLEQLIDFAILIKNPASHEPIFPLAVVKDADNTTEQLLANNRMLEKAIQHASATDHSVQLVSRIDVNVAGGILRAIRELLITEVVIGWNGKVTARQKIFGTVLDNLLEQSRQMILVCKFLHPLNTMQRVVVVVPPNAEREQGFATWVHNVRTLAKQIGADLNFRGETETLQTLEVVMQQGRSSIDVVYKPFHDWSNFASLSQNIRPDDLLIVISARQGSLSHTGALDYVPKQLARHFTQSSFVIIYPEQIWEA